MKFGTRINARFNDRIQHCYKKEHNGVEIRKRQFIFNTNPAKGGFHQM